MNARDSSPAPAGSDESLAGRAEVVLLTVDGADFRQVGVDASDGVVTLSGEVKTESERKQAAAVVRKLDGVHDVNNQLRVAHEAFGRSPDQALKTKVEAALKSDKTLDGATVESAGVGAVRVDGAGIPGQILENGSDLVPGPKGVQ